MQASFLLGFGVGMMFVGAAGQVGVAVHERWKLRQHRSAPTTPQLSTTDPFEQWLIDPKATTYDEWLATRLVREPRAPELPIPIHTEDGVVYCNPDGTLLHLTPDAPACPQPNRNAWLVGHRVKHWDIEEAVHSAVEINGDATIFDRRMEPIAHIKAGRFLWVDPYVTPKLIVPMFGPTPPARQI